MAFIQLCRDQVLLSLMLPNYLEMCCSTFTSTCYPIMKEKERRKENSNLHSLNSDLVPSCFHRKLVCSCRGRCRVRLRLLAQFTMRVLNNFSLKKKVLLFFFSKSFDLSSSYSVDYRQMTATSRRGTKQVSQALVHTLNWGLTVQFSYFQLSVSLLCQQKEKEFIAVYHFTINACWEAPFVSQCLPYEGGE